MDYGMGVFNGICKIIKTQHSELLRRYAVFLLSVITFLNTLNKSVRRISAAEGYYFYSICGYRRIFVYSCQQICKESIWTGYGNGFRLCGRKNNLSETQSRSKYGSHLFFAGFIGQRATYAK